MALRFGEQVEMFQVGHLVELTEEERDDLRLHARAMMFEAMEEGPGWFREYLIAHRASHAVILAIFARSHAT